MIDVERELNLLRRRVEASVVPRSNSLERVLGRSRRARFANAAVAIVAIASVVTGSVATIRVLDGDPAPPEVRTSTLEESFISFQAAEGWHTTAFTWNGLSRAWASTEPIAEQDRQSITGENPTGWPNASMEALSADGILVVVTEDIRSRNELPTDDRWPERDRLVFDEPSAPAMTGEGSFTAGASTSFGATIEGRHVSALAVFGAAEPSDDLIAAANAQLNRLVVEPAPAPTDELDDVGVTMDLPDGWDGILYTWGVVPTLHASTTEVEELYPGRRTRNGLGSEDFFVFLSESDLYAEYQALDGPPAITEEDRCDVCEVMDGGVSAPAGHALYYRSFTLGNRLFELWVEFGSAEPNADHLQRVNDALSSLRVDARDSGIGSLGEITAPGTPVRVPDGWVERSDAFGDGISAYGTWDLPAGGRCGPEAALAALPTDGALLWIVQRLDAPNAGDYSPLHPRFGIDLQNPPGRWECAAEAPSRLYRFRTAGQYLELYVAFGPNAGPDRVAEAEDLIHSIDG